MATILAFPPTLTDAELLAELGVEDIPADLFLKPGETIRDRIPAKLARGRELTATKRRAAFHAV